MSHAKPLPKPVLLALIVAALSFVPLSPARAATSGGVRIPALTSPVMDGAGVIRRQERQSLERYLASLSEQTGVQIVVFTVPTLAGEPIEALSMRACEAWRLGRQGEDGGVLLTVAMQEREVRIEVGYGLEGELTDAKSGAIIRNRITPHFKEGDYTAGIVSGVQAIAGVVTGGKAPAQAATDAVAHDDGADWGMELLSLVIFALVFLFYLRHPLLAFLGMAPRRRWYDGDDRRGGNFRGGGGRFGGGGASGHW